jgi:hypothetical protein
MSSRKEEISRVAAELAARLAELEAVVETLTAGLAQSQEQAAGKGDAGESSRPGDG